MKEPLQDTKVVATSFAVSSLDVLVNLIVALMTGSTVMLAQMLQGLSDLITAAFLYHGVRASKRGRNERYSFGYGREVYFWVMISAMFMFFGTGLLSIYFGWKQFSHPEHISNSWLAIAVLCFVFVTNGYALLLSIRRLTQEQHTKATWIRKIIASSMIETKTTFIIDLLGTSAALVGLIAIGLFALSGDVRFDGLGGIIIGIAMMIGSLLLIYDVKGFIVGRSIPRAQATKLIRHITKLQGVERILDLRTAYIGSTRLLVIIEVHFHDDLTTDQIESLSDEIKRTTSKTVPHASIIQVEVETPDEEL